MKILSESFAFMMFIGMPNDSKLMTLNDFYVILTRNIITVCMEIHWRILTHTKKKKQHTKYSLSSALYRVANDWAIWISLMIQTRTGFYWMIACKIYKTFIASWIRKPTQYWNIGNFVLISNFQMFICQSISTPVEKKRERTKKIHAAKCH